MKTGCNMTKSQRKRLIRSAETIIASLPVEGEVCQNGELDVAISAIQALLDRMVGLATVDRTLRRMGQLATVSRRIDYSR